MNEDSPEIRHYKKILTRLDKSFEKKVENFLSNENIEFKGKNWLYKTIHNNTNWDFVYYFPKLSINYPI